MFNTGFSWLDGTNDLVSNGDEAYGDSAEFINQERLDEDLAAAKIAVVETDGAKGLVVAPLIGSYAASGSGTTNATMDVYGVFGMGETSQTSFGSNPILVTHLSKVTLGTVTSGGAAAVLDNNMYISGGTGQLDLIHPTTGSTYSQFVGCGAATDEKCSLWSALASGGTPTNSVDAANLTIAGAGGTPDDAGICAIADISAFQKVIFSVYMGSLTCKANALVARLY
tara:strand:+ start:7330 stop:8007 length:678 start_codon:yes stop_codon:yes gene_type:complete